VDWRKKNPKRGKTKPQISRIKQMMKVKGYPPYGHVSHCGQNRAGKTLCPIRICVIGEICGLVFYFNLSARTFLGRPVSLSGKSLQCVERFAV
jgi:hypothetical protein